MSLDEQCQRLRDLVHNCISDHLYSSAIFYADKLVTLTNGAPSDVYLLAEAYFISQQYRRALSLLRRDGMIENDLRFKHLAARCLAECKEWEECLNVLGDGTDPEQLEPEPKGHQPGNNVCLPATICLLRARAFQALDNRTRAVMWYRHALLRDAYCYEAFSALIEGHLLTCEEERELVSELRVHEDDRWLLLLLSAKCKKYNLSHKEMEEALAELEAPFNPMPASEPRAAARCPATSGTHALRDLNRHRDSLMTGLTASTATTTPSTGPYGSSLPLARGRVASRAPGAAAAHASGRPATSHQPQQQPGSQAAAASQPGRHPHYPQQALHMLDAMGTPSVAATPSLSGTPMTLGATPSPMPLAGASPATNTGFTAGITPASIAMDQTPLSFGGSGRVMGRTGPGADYSGSVQGSDMEADTPMSLGQTTPITFSLNQAQPPATGDAAARRDAVAPGPRGPQFDLVTPAPNMGEVHIQPGCGLGGNVDVLTCRADCLFHRGAYEACHELCERVLESDPYALQALPLSLSSALVLGRRSELFMRGHNLVAEYPSHAVAWYAVGLYYMASRQYEAARRYLSKATSLDPGFAPAWVAFGHAFSAQDERDQAMAAYRTAARLFPGLHLPVLGMGMEYSAMNNLPLAERMLMAAHELCPGDAVTCHELGVCAYKAGNVSQAMSWLHMALQLASAVQVGKGTCDLSCSDESRLQGLSPSWEPTVLALGHCLRKQGALQDALLWYNKALSMSPGQPGTLAAVGYTHQLMGNIPRAIEAYHACLAIKPDDSFAAEMLNLALTDFALYD